MCRQYSNASDEGPLVAHAPAADCQDFVRTGTLGSDSGRRSVGHCYHRNLLVETLEVSGIPGSEAANAIGHHRGHDIAVMNLLPRDTMAPD
jgi:hypothetical protein